MEIISVNYVLGGKYNSKEGIFFNIREFWGKELEDGKNI